MVQYSCDRIMFKGADINVDRTTLNHPLDDDIQCNSRFAGHKTMYGPTGISGFVMNPSIKMPAVIFGGTGYESANQDMPESLPERYEMGEYIVKLSSIPQNPPHK